MPAGVAATAFTLAEKTGWRLDYILWEIPISVITQANHVFIWMAGLDSKRVRRTKSKELSEIAKLIGIES